MNRPALSVVVIGRNEGERLIRCLRSIHAMSFVGGDVEVLYVDSDSRDGSPARAEAEGALVISVQPTRPTAALGRNAGWRAASAEFVLFLDGDTILHPDFVARAMEEFRDPQIAVVCGQRREIQPEASLYNRVLDLDWISQPGFVDYCGGDALMRRSVLEEVGGYDETLIAGEEPEMCRRMRGLGYRIVHRHIPMTGHDLAMTRWSQYWRRATRTGQAYREVSERFRGTNMPFWELEARHNCSRAVILLSIAFTALMASALLRSMLPFAGAVIFFVLLSIRTAWKMRWKTPDWGTRLLYGLHSHVQQIPIFAGQLMYLRDRRAGRRRGLIEYKGLGS